MVKHFAAFLWIFCIFCGFQKHFFYEKVPQEAHRGDLKVYRWDFEKHIPNTTDMFHYFIISIYKSNTYILLHLSRLNNG